MAETVNRPHKVEVSSKEKAMLLNAVVMAIGTFKRQKNRVQLPEVARVLDVHISELEELAELMKR